LLEPAALAASRNLRQRMGGMTPINAMNDLLTDLRRTKTNADLIKTLAE
jgi:transcription termination factor Rho